MRRTWENGGRGLLVRVGVAVAAGSVGLTLALSLCGGIMLGRAVMHGDWQGACRQKDIDDPALADSRVGSVDRDRFHRRGGDRRFR